MKVGRASDCSIDRKRLVVSEVEEERKESEVLGRFIPAGALRLSGYVGRDSVVIYPEC